MSKQINRHAWDNIQLSGHPVTAAFWFHCFNKLDGAGPAFRSWQLFN
jgi:hypothetical protein